MFFAVKMTQSAIYNVKSALGRVCEILGREVCNPKSDSAISNFFQKDMIYCPIKGMNGCSGCGHATKGAGAAGIYGTRPNRGRYNG